MGGAGTFLRWIYYANSILERDAIQAPFQGCLCHVLGIATYQYIGTSWIRIAVLETFPTDKVYCRNSLSHSGTTFNLPAYDFPDPIFLLEDEGNLIFDVYVGGNKQYYRSPGMATVFGEFEIDHLSQNIVFPVALDSERVQVKAYIV